LVETTEHPSDRRFFWRIADLIERDLEKMINHATTPCAFATLKRRAASVQRENCECFIAHPKRFSGSKHFLDKRFETSNEVVSSCDASVS